ncbi:allantoinase [Terriglobus roseus DSM 18391]|uniref:allantoinase n=2 Tax=Terriglobus roseus TaxID=392734 RepID=I3ZD76_TERRK|nr:allantoinase [Terriglobus roseus DSM 18391]
MASMRQAWISQRVITPMAEHPAAVLVEDGIILDVCGISAVPSDAHIRDVGELPLMPGLVDSHVHINEPGRTDWEGFETATRAAAAGGYTTLIDMPLNCLPETTTVAALEAKRAAAQGKCRVDWMSWGGAVDGNADHLQPLANAGVPGYKCFLVYPGCEGFTSIDAANLEAALPILAQTGLPLLVHAELQGPIDAAGLALPNAENPAWRQYATYLASRPDEAELAAIAMLIDLCRRYRFRLHIVHLATAQAVEMLRSAKAKGLPITVETCPHYLHLYAEAIADGATEFKCAPPVRSQANREALWKALAAGVIDLVATDHSPCPPAMKRKEDGRFNTAWGGIASLSTALPVMWTEAQARGFTLRDIARWMSGAPAALAGLRHRVGGIEPGRDANFILFDPDAETIVTEDLLHYRHKVSPYMGEQLRGRVRETVLRGHTVYADGNFPGDNRGLEYKR